LSASEKKRERRPSPYLASRRMLKNKKKEREGRHQRLPIRAFSEKKEGRKKRGALAGSQIPATPEVFENGKGGRKYARPAAPGFSPEARKEKKKRKEPHLKGEKGAEKEHRILRRAAEEKKGGKEKGTLGGWDAFALLE